MRSRLRAAGAGGWAPRQRRGRAHDPVLGRRPAPALGQLATSAPRLCLQRRAGPRRTGLPTNVAPTQRTRRDALRAVRGELGGGRGRERSAALLRSSGPRSPSRAPAAFAELRVRAVLAPATFSAAPSTSTVHGCGCPVLVRGDTSVASQHSAPPLAVAP